MKDGGQRRRPKTNAAGSSRRSFGGKLKSLQALWLGGVVFALAVFGMTAVFMHRVTSDHHVHLTSMDAGERQRLRSVLAAQHGPSQSAGATVDDNGLRSQRSAGVGSNHRRTGTEEREIYTVFSTSCSDQMHWESYVLFYHAAKVKQPGTVTRICSGCNAKEAKWIQNFHDRHVAPMNPGNFHLHLTPSFGKLEKADGSKAVYKYMNKPLGLLHWMRNFLHLPDIDDPFAVDPSSPVDNPVEDGVIVLMDPDMILFRPLTGDFTNENMIYTDASGTNNVRRVEHGRPMSQHDGYLDNRWMMLNVTHITNGRASRLVGVAHKDGPLHWNTGPPYIATVRDMHRIAQVWADYAPRVHDVHPHIFAEMFGYIHATVQLGLPHTLVKSIVVSTTQATNREGWSFVDTMDDTEICMPQPVAGRNLPVGLHYCKRYALDWWFFSKYRLKKKFISCETPLLRLPPVDLATKNYTVMYWPPPHGHRGEYVAPKEAVGKRTAKREAFMLCGLMRAINEAALHFKQSEASGCVGKPTTNMSEVYSIHEDPDH